MSPSESSSLEITRPPFFFYIYILYTLYFASSIASYKDRRPSSKDFPALPASPCPLSLFLQRKRESAATMGLHGPGERGGWSAKTGGLNKCERGRWEKKKKKKREVGKDGRFFWTDVRISGRASFWFAKAFSGIVVLCVARVAHLFSVIPAASSSFPVTRPLSYDRLFLPAHSPGYFS